MKQSATTSVSIGTKASQSSNKINTIKVINNSKGQAGKKQEIKRKFKEISPMMKIPSDVVLYILEFCEIIIIPTSVNVVNVKKGFLKILIKKWFGKFPLDGGIRLIFKNGIVKDFKYDLNLKQVKFLLRAMKNSNSSNISYWERQFLYQMNRISDTRKLEPEKLSEVSQDFIGCYSRTGMLKIRTEYLQSYIKYIESFKSISKENEILANNIKHVSFEYVPNLELAHPLLNLFSNMQILSLDDSFANELCNNNQTYNTCTSVEVKMYYWKQIDFALKFPNLETFTFNEFYSEQMLDKLVVLQQLKSLTVVELIHRINVSFYHLQLEECKLVSQFPQLKTLILSSISICDTESLYHLTSSKTLSTLKVLAVAKLSHATPIFNRESPLTSLSVQGSISSKVLMALIRQGENLQFFEISFLVLSKTFPDL